MRAGLCLTTHDSADLLRYSADQYGTSTAAESSATHRNYMQHYVHDLLHKVF